MDSTFLQDRITYTKNLIITYETALSELAAGKISQYTLNTGQGTQTVTKYNISTLNNHLDILYNRLCALDARANGGATNIARPGW